MSAATNLKLRGTVWYARLVVPLELQAALGRRELQKSLNTHDLRTAKVRLLPVLAQWHREFEQLRCRREISEADLTAATWAHYTAELEQDRRDRALPDDESAGRAFAAISRRYQLEALRDHLGRGETALISWAADDYIAKNRLLIEQGSSQYRELCFRLMRAQIEVIERANERDRGDYAGAPRDPIVIRVDAPVETAKPGETVAELFEQYARENPNGIAQATLEQARRDVGTFIDLRGIDFPVSGIDKKSVREWKALLQRYPVKAAEIAAFKGLSFREIIQANDDAKEPRKVIASGTVNRYMAGFGGFCNWLAAHEYIAANPFTDMYLKVDKRKKKGRVFSPEKLSALLASPLFHGCKSDKVWHLAGDHKIRDHRYWLPHVMMWSGARPGEIAQLAIDDVKELHGTWVMHIIDDASDDEEVEQRVKTDGSRRVLPIHSKLMALGFVDYRRKMKAAGHTRLFPEVERSANGQIASAFGKKFNDTFLKRLGLKEPRLSLYSLRHGFADAMRRAGYMDEEFGFLMGHDKASTTGLYGQLPPGLLGKRVTMIEAIAYDGA